MARHLGPIKAVAEPDGSAAGTVEPGPARAPAPDRPRAERAGARSLTPIQALIIGPPALIERGSSSRPAAIATARPGKLTLEQSEVFQCRDGAI